MTHEYHPRPHRCLETRGNQAKPGAGLSRRTGTPVGFGTTGSRFSCGLAKRLRARNHRGGEEGVAVRGCSEAEFDPLAIARIYADNGAAAISVLTDEPFFQGKLSYLTDIRRAVSPPLLRKDFILDPYQLLEARARGGRCGVADRGDSRHDGTAFAVAPDYDLGMQGRWSNCTNRRIYRACWTRGQRSSASTIATSALSSLDSNRRWKLPLAFRIIAAWSAKAESATREDMDRLQAGGVKAVLIGETFMRSPDIGAKVRELRTPCF